MDQSTPDDCFCTSPISKSEGLHVVCIRPGGPTLSTKKLFQSLIN